MRTTLETFARQAGVTIDILERTDSTNNRAADSRYDAGDVVIAERQEAGRGQRGNSWNSPPGENLTFSVVLRPDFLAAERQFRISKAAALAVADTIAETGLRPAIKWPNDIYIGDRKVTGILIENDLSGSFLCRSVIGVGLNVNQTRFDPSLPNPTSLAAEAGHPFDRAGVFICFYRRLAERYRTLAEEESAQQRTRPAGMTGRNGKENGTHEAPARRNGREAGTPGDRLFSRIDDDYLRLLYRFGEEHLFTDGRSRRHFLGTITGVLPAGELEVRHSADGRVRNYLFKEIEYVIRNEGI